MSDMFQKYIVPLLLSGVSVLAPIKAILLTVGFLIFADLITGIMAARKRAEKISSAAMRRTVSKMAVYHIVIISGFLVETYLLEGSLPVTKLAAGMIGAVELTSILENANSIHGSNLFSKLIKLLGSKNDV